MRAEFRPTSSRDAAAVAAFLQRVFGMAPGHPTVNAGCMQWKYWDECPNWPGSRGFVMIREDDIIAHGAVVPFDYPVGDRRLKVVHLIDWAAEPNSVGSGVTLLKRIGQTADMMMAAGGSEMTQKILPALGFKVCGEVTRYVLPLRPLQGLVSLEDPTWKSGAKFLRNTIWSWQAPTGQVHGWEVYRVAPEHLASAAIPWPKPGHGGASLERTEELMRYYLRCPVTPMEIYTVAKEGLVRGWFLLATAPAQTRLVDFWIDSDDDGDWRVLVRLAVQQAKQNHGVAEIVSMANDPVTHRYLVDCGFHARGTDPLRVLASRGSELHAMPVRMRMLDGDSAWLHSGHPDFWA